MGEAHAGRLFDHVHLRVSDLEASRRFYEAALAAGGRYNGAPGERSYHSGYYAVERSALSVAFTWDEPE
jgi:catechol 2,3-dioxygenase-like lactoylglutathione lyase family enzyme